MLSIPERVMRSDVIVAAYVSEPTTHSCKLAVSETLLGTAQHEISVTNTKSIPFREGAGGIFFLVSSKDHLTLVYPSAFELDRLDDVRRVIEMRTSPSKYFADPHYASSPEFLEMIGLLFREKQAVDGLSRQAAIDHLRDTLTSPNKDAVIRAVGALRALGSKDSAAVIPLLQHPDAAVRLLTAQFLTWAPDPEAVGPLCELLDGVNDSYDPIETEIGRALIEIGDSSAVPALERATRRGVFGGTSWALGRLGDKKSFEILLEGVEKRDALDAVEGLMSLVRRSNKPFEAWMGVSSWTEQSGLEHRQDWLDWWKQNKSDFQVIKTAKEADGTEQDV